MNMNRKSYWAFVVYDEDTIISKWETHAEILNDVVVDQTELCKWVFAAG
jgi:hypothetical protein